MRKNVMKLTAGVLSTAVLAGMFATGIPTKIAAATEHWNAAEVGVAPSVSEYFEI